MQNSTSIAIIGGGVSGILTALHLFRQAPGRARITIFETKRSHIGRGAAYSTTSEHHLLNVRASGMSLFTEEPTHFTNWLSQRGLSYSADAFVPRKIFGRYIEETFEEVRSAAGECIKIVRRAVESLDELEEFDQIVLAMGNFTPTSIPAFEEKKETLKNYFENPWTVTSKDLIDAESVCVIGMGLTGVDVLVDLLHSNYKGKIHAISRHGVFPQAHPLTHGEKIPGAPKLTGSLSRKMRTMRKWLSSGAYSWQGALDSLRPNNQKLWAELSPMEQKRFLRHLRPFWDIHRHRMAPELSSLLLSAMKSGQLVTHRGFVTAVSSDPTGLQITLEARKAEKKSVAAQSVVNCTGPASFKSLDDPFVRSLLDEGVAAIDEHGLGFLSDRHGRLIGRSTQPIWVIGPLRKGTLWESTALREIRDQALQLAKDIYDPSFFFKSSPNVELEL